ncbi:MAG: hypothetical protein ACKV2V_14110 [Blastocatellia bacterium]
MTIWVTDDNLHVPVKAIAKTSTGTISLVLTRHQKPASASSR